MRVYAECCRCGGSLRTITRLSRRARRFVAGWTISPNFKSRRNDTLPWTAWFCWYQSHSTPLTPFRRLLSTSPEHVVAESMILPTAFRFRISVQPVSWQPHRHQIDIDLIVTSVPSLYHLSVLHCHQGVSGLMICRRCPLDCLMAWRPWNTCKCTTVYHIVASLV